MTFLETRLDLGYDFGASYGPRFSTAIAIQSNGQEQRRAMWSQPLIVASLAGRKVNKTELDYLLAFHAAAKGSAYGFRLRDWSDYKSGLVAIGTGNGTAQTWQLVKRYTVAGNTVTRPITKPVADSLTLYLNGVPTVGGWSLNTTNGLLSTTLTGAIAVEFEFDVPVRFEQDQINFTFDAADPFDSSRRLFTLENLTLTEIRIEPQIYPPLDPLPASLPQINLGYDYGTQGGPTFDTGILATSSEFEKRTPYLTDPLGTWNIGDRRLLRSELDYLIGFFRVARGMAIPFQFKDWQTESLQTVRFAEDRISVQFAAHDLDSGESIFDLAGLSVKAINETSPPPGSYTLYLRYKKKIADPFTDIYFTFNAISVVSILLGELNSSNGGIGVTGFPTINQFPQTTGGETLYVQVQIVDAENVTRFLLSNELVEPILIGTGANPQPNWITVAGYAWESTIDLPVFEYVTLIEN